MDNEEMRQGWSSTGVGWVANARIFDATMAPMADAVIAAAELVPGQRVLDVGCGFGTLLELADAAGTTPVGVDISDSMVEAARRRVPAAEVLLADAQTEDLLQGGAGGFERVVSRFGVMFFADPVAAFANIRRACVPGARLAFVCWRSGENEIFTLGTEVLTARMAPDEGEGEDAGAPGPQAFGEPERVREILTGAGWADVDLVAQDAPLDYGFDGTDGVEERLSVILATTTGQSARAELEPTLGPDGWASLVDEVRAELRRHLLDGAVRPVAHTWVVTATNPAA
ncbi:class I SAM-dependent methyltransferase [Nocardioides sp. Root140]|uniref:class I SAM-dependent methyltransferase n=1 Tax=Nocardioides sp. Root140 TaxID=1736460 RepID=UPI0006F93B47|nr:class I SAM-dependent methyltransferase [Nocardioides sp. Root140]KQY57707.1 methyltransferase type 11 [Nocardioides sp. Root140]